MAWLESYDIRMLVNERLGYLGARPSALTV
jgi:hypothetical protein